MGQRGPAPLPPAQQRVHRVGVWLSEVELQELAAAIGEPGLVDLVMNGGKEARKGYKRASEFMRDRALGRRVRMVVPEVNRQAYGHLGRLGNNINQLAAAVNGGLLSLAERQVLDGVLADLQAVRRALLGLQTPVGVSPATASVDDLDFKFEF